MKISQPIDNPVAISTNAALTAKSAPMAGALAKSDAAKSTQTAGVAVTVSRMARSLEAAGSSEAPDVDMNKVNAVRSAIAEGAYQINPEAIADKLLSNAGEMLQRSRI
jgi:negative regulator of flagellin synthesis FlgM